MIEARYCDIMLVSSETEHLINVCKELRYFGMNVSQSENIKRVNAGLAAHSPAFLLLDGDIEGIKPFLIEMSKCYFCPMPYIMVAGTFANRDDRITMLNLGADTCISKPISVEEILSVARSVYRRESKLARLHCGKWLPRIEHKELTIDPLRRTVTMRGELIELTLKEFDMLNLLAHHAGEVLTKEEIFKLVWKEEYYATSTGVPDHISSLRRKLKLDKKDKDYIQTIFGVGYRFADE